MYVSKGGHRYMTKTRLFTRLGIVGTLLAGALVVTLAPPAHSVEASLAATNSSTWQTNASVQGLAVAAGKAYAGGRFTSVRPPGAAPGTGEVAQAYLAAFDAGTGALVSTFNPVLNGQVYAVAASADGSRIFVGGDFTTVNGQTRNRIAAFDTATGALVANWKPSVSYRVKSIAVSGTTVYFGGSFGLVNGVDRLRLAAVTTDTGTLLPWAPATNGDVYAVDAADGDNGASKVYAGGQFSTVNGTTQNTVTSLDPVSGAVLPFPGASAVPPPNGSCTTRVKAIDASGDTVYFGNGGDGGGCFDGTWAVDIATNTLKWKNQCLGATEAVKVVNGWLYKGSHAHDCANQGAGGFPQGFGYRFLLSEKLTDGTLGPWFPNTDADPNSVTNVGPLAFATGGSDLWAGGDFLNVNGAGQQGLTRFTNATPGAAPAKPAKLLPYSVQPGVVEIHFPTVVDNDDSTLTYRLLKGFTNTTIATWTAKSTPWDRPWLSYTDTSSAPGEVTNYRVEVTDGSTTIRGNYSDQITVASAASTAYDQIVNADGPQAYWRLGEPAGTTASVDASGQSNNGTFTGVTLGGAGAIAGNTVHDDELDHRPHGRREGVQLPAAIHGRGLGQAERRRPWRPDHRLRQLEDREQRRWRRPDALHAHQRLGRLRRERRLAAHADQPVRQERRPLAPRGRQLRQRDDEAVRRRRPQRKRPGRLGVGVLRLVAGRVRPDQLLARWWSDPDRNGHRRGGRLPVRTHSGTGPIPLCSKVKRRLSASSRTNS